MPHARINVDQARVLLRDAKPHVLDMRDNASYMRGHVPGARLLTDDLIAEFVRTGRRTEPTLLYCYHGNTSQPMARMLSHMGFSQLHELAGGYQAWEQAAAESGTP